MIYSFVASEYLTELGYETKLFKCKIEDVGDHYYVEFDIGKKPYIVDNDPYIYEYWEYICRFKPKYKRRLSIKAIKDMSNYFNDRINRALYVMELNGRPYASYDDAVLKIRQSLQHKISHEIKMT